MPSPVRIWLDNGTLADSPDLDFVYPLYFINLGNNSVDPDVPTATATALSDLASLPVENRGISLAYLVEDVFYNQTPESILANYQENNGIFLPENIMDRATYIADAFAALPLSFLFTNCELSPIWESSYNAAQTFWTDPFARSLMPEWISALSPDASDDWLNQGPYGRYCRAIMACWMTRQVLRSIHKILSDSGLRIYNASPTQIWVNSPACSIQNPYDDSQYNDLTPHDYNGWPMFLYPPGTRNCIQAYSNASGAVAMAYPEAERGWRAFMNDMRSIKLMPNCIPEIWPGNQNESLRNLTLAHSLRMFSSTIKYRDILLFSQYSTPEILTSTLEYIQSQEGADHEAPDRNSIIDVSADTITTGDLTSTIGDYVP